MSMDATRVFAAQQRRTFDAIGGGTFTAVRLRSGVRAQVGQLAEWDGTPVAMTVLAHLTARAAIVEAHGVTDLFSGEKFKDGPLPRLTVSGVSLCGAEIVDSLSDAVLLQILEWANTGEIKEGSEVEKKPEASPSGSIAGDSGAAPN